MTAFLFGSGPFSSFYKAKPPHLIELLPLVDDMFSLPLYPSLSFFLFLMRQVVKEMILKKTKHI
jgi:hypothetical protein